MKIILSSASPEPIYAQIASQIRAAIASGELTDGEALPSLRRLARELRISVLTVTRAYSQLAKEGLVANVQGRGSFVTGNGGQVLKRQLEQKVRAALAQTVTFAGAAGMQPRDLHRMLDELLGGRADAGGTGTDTGSTKEQS